MLSIVGLRFEFPDFLPGTWLPEPVSQPLLLMHNRLIPDSLHELSFFLH